MPIDFSKDEIRLLQRLSGERPSWRITFWMALLIPPVLFAAGSIYRSDVFLLGLAFVGLLAITLWFAVGSLKNGKLLSSIAAKVLDENKHPGP